MQHSAFPSRVMQYLQRPMEITVAITNEQQNTRSIVKHLVFAKQQPFWLQDI